MALSIDGLYQEMGPAEDNPNGWAFTPFMNPAVEKVRPGWNKAFKNQLTVDQVQQVIIKAAHDVERIAKQLVRVDTGALCNSIHVVRGATFTIEFEAGRAISGAEAQRRGLELV